MLQTMWVLRTKDLLGCNVRLESVMRLPINRLNRPVTITRPSPLKTAFTKNTATLSELNNDEKASETANASATFACSIVAVRYGKTLLNIRLLEF